MTSLLVFFGVSIIILIMVAIRILKKQKRSDAYGGAKYIERSDEEIEADIKQGKFTSRLADDPGMILDPNKVPEDLRDLIPLTKKWAVGDDVERAIFERLASFEEKKELADKVWHRIKRIDEFYRPLRDKVHETYEDLYFDIMTEAADEIYYDVYPEKSPSQNKNVKNE